MPVKSASLFGTILLYAALSSIANAQDKPTISLEAYTCKQFLMDAQHPNTPQKLIRTLMLISWATGYAAAHDRSQLRADSKALELISAAIHISCTKTPNEAAIVSISGQIDRYAEKAAR